MPGGKGKIGPGDGRQWVKGQSGNPKGAPKKLPELDKLLADVLGNGNGDKTAAEQILIALYKNAKKGNVRAAEVLLERAYGKVSQGLDFTGDLGLEIVRTIVSKKV